MTVRLYKSSDGSAPVYTGTVGDKVNLLDKVLVSGYGSATPAGWTKPYTGSPSGQQAVFRQGSGLQYYLNVDDAAPGAGGAKEARVRGYEAMTAFATGTNLFPTAAQATNGGFVRKSATADSTPRPWIMVADDQTFWHFTQSGDTAGVYLGWGFGSLASFKSGDLGRVGLFARPTENATTASLEPLDQFAIRLGTTAAQNTALHTLARSVTQAVGAITTTTVSIVPSDASILSSTGFNGILNYTNAADNRTYLSSILVYENSAASAGDKRGRLRGLWFFAHAISNAADGDTFNGTQDLAGKQFMIIKQSTNGGVFCIEISDTWETSS